MRKNPPNLWLCLDWAAPLAVMVAIFIASSFPGPRVPQPRFPHSDKVMHFAAYGVLGFLWARALRRRTGLSPVAAAAAAVAVTSLYGATDEWHQSFTPQRSCDVWDWVADTLGAVAAQPLWHFVEQRTSKTSPENDLPPSP